MRFQNNNNDDTLFIQLDNIVLLFSMHNCKNTELPPEMQIPYKIMFLTTHLIKINNHGLCNTNIYQIENLIKAPTRWHCVTLQVQAFVQS